MNDKIRDLIRVVNVHEALRAQHGPGNAALLDPRYTLAHLLMSKLARDLSGELPGIVTLADLITMVQKYEDLPEHIGYDNIIIGSC